jgi:hypothetical protein
MNQQDVTFAFCGDIMPGAEVGQHIGAASVADWLSGVIGAWQSADLVVGNLECPCVLNAKPVDGVPPELVFHAPSGRLRELAAAGFTAFTLANNHILNCGPAGLQETIRGLDDIGIYHVGAGMNLAEALQPVFIPVKGKTVALVAFCYGPPATANSPGVAPAEPHTMQSALATARAGANIVIGVLHDGLEYSDVPPSKVRDRFRFLADNGADIVIGHHPHVLQGLEWRGNIPIAYSLGDLLFHNSLPHVAIRNFERIAMGRYAPTEVRRDPGKFARGAVLTVRISHDGQKTIQWHPFHQSENLRPRLDVGRAYDDSLRRLDELSGALLNADDPRHGLADTVVDRVRHEQLASLSARDALRLLRRPRLRHLRAGIPWLYHRARKTLKRFSQHLLSRLQALVDHENRLPRL